MTRERVKLMIELADSVSEANAIIENDGMKSIKEKMAFLKGMFNFELIGRCDNPEMETNAEVMDYYAILNTIINEKWN